MLDEGRFDLNLEDFNMNIQYDGVSREPRTAFWDYELVANKPAHFNGGVIDHLYLHHMFFNGSNFHS